MRFLVSEVRDAGVVRRQEDLDPATLIGTPPDFVSFRPPLKANVEARMMPGEILVTGRVKTVLELKCARCLETFDRPYEVRFSQTYTPDLSEFDVTEEIREAVLLDVPYKSVCKESCKGLCAQCGKNLNQPGCTCAQKPAPEKPEDLRWTALKKFPFR